GPRLRTDGLLLRRPGPRPRSRRPRRQGVTANAGRGPTRSEALINAAHATKRTGGADGRQRGPPETAAGASATGPERVRGAGRGPRCAAACAWLWLEGARGAGGAEAQARGKLEPPSQRVTSTTSPMKDRPGT